MYRPISSHGDRGDAVKLGDFVAIPGSKGFVVSVEEGGHLKLKGCRHRFLQGFGATQSYARADRRASRPLPLGPSRHFAAARQLGRFWSEAEIKGQGGSASLVANDPLRSSSGRRLLLHGNRLIAAARMNILGHDEVRRHRYLPPSAESPGAICESPSCTTDATRAPSRVNTLPRAMAQPPALDGTCCE